MSEINEAPEIESLQEDDQIKLFQSTEMEQKDAELKSMNEVILDSEENNPEQSSIEKNDTEERSIREDILNNENEEKKQEKIIEEDAKSVTKAANQKDDNI